ncbi:hypothetical protein F9C07_2149 [Aspergillus flavus]|uniref:Uncharacterized protein n=1 Tax=Aspergillus flavus (strain ATCC 200026 / FGSC A1120 / IAM 13836 / NRRL 3357 / JCM 12722 / SRRC 167) TaxID=332952 RepID=A0A7U2MFT0_ASPFN|nr:hypothetical protein F9C07_2149 [Aspergillus flavus]
MNPRLSFTPRALMPIFVRSTLRSRLTSSKRNALSGEGSIHHPIRQYGAIMLVMMNYLQMW